MFDLELTQLDRSFRQSGDPEVGERYARALQRAGATEEALKFRRLHLSPPEGEVLWVRLRLDPRPYKVGYQSHLIRPGERLDEPRREDFRPMLHSLCGAQWKMSQWYTVLRELAEKCWTQRTQDMTDYGSEKDWRGPFAFDVEPPYPLQIERPKTNCPVCKKRQPVRFVFLKQQAWSARGTRTYGVCRKTCSGCQRFSGLGNLRKHLIFLREDQQGDPLE